MQFAAIAAFAAAAVASVNAATCNTTIIASLLTSDDVTTCSSDSGYEFSSMSTPTDAEITAMCGDSACLAALSALESSGLGDCTIGSFSIMTDLVTPIVTACNDTTGATTTASSGSGATTTEVGASSTSGEDDTVETSAPATSSSGSAEAAASASASASASGSVSASASSSGSAVTVTSALVGSVLLAAAFNA